jgi:hypothetical protein
MRKARANMDPWWSNEDTAVLKKIYLLTWSCLFVGGTLAVGARAWGADAQHTGRPVVWMMPPGQDNGRALRELFEQPESWRETRSLVDVLGYADHNLDRQFTDDQLRTWFARLREWGIKLGLETGAIKPWGRTGESTFRSERPKWERFERLGGGLYALALDEPLLCCRKDIHQSDEYAVAETAAFITLVRRMSTLSRAGSRRPPGACRKPGTSPSLAPSAILPASSYRCSGSRSNDLPHAGRADRLSRERPESARGCACRR